VLILLIGLLWMLGAKFIAISGHDPENLFMAWLAVALPDVIFFAAVGLLMGLMHLLMPHWLAARLSMVIAAIVLLWSVIASAWLIATGIQLQPGVLGVLGHEPGQFWPVVANHIRRKLLYSIPLLATCAAVLVWFLWRLARPVRQSGGRRGAMSMTLWTGVLLIGIVFCWILAVFMPLGYTGEVLGFSGHWYALRDLVALKPHPGDVDRASRRLARQGDRLLTPPSTEPRELPNVVVVLLESISYAASGLENPDEPRMETLAALAQEGVEFRTTRVPIPYTSKAFWATFTGSTPDVQSDAAEAVLADGPYESLASILSTLGYRTAFFEMSKGSFECAPGLFANLGFDKAWFRENLEDDTASLGYFSGDDFRLLEPAFNWVDQGGGPFLLTMITSVAHDPYEVPQWYAPSAQTKAERYLQAIRFTDDFLGAVLEQLEQRGLAENTIVCVLGDHGEDTRPEIRKSRWAPFDEVLRVPWIIRWPGRIEGPLRVEGLSSQLDVTPTLLSLLGFKIDEAGFEGIDALGPIDPDRRLHFAAWYPDSPRGFVQSDKKIVYWPYNGAVFEYDLIEDPQEQDPRTIEDGPERDRLIEEIEQWRRGSHLVIPATRFREEFLYGHWWVFSSGRSAWAYYVP
jgi:hypothetical protein